MEDVCSAGGAFLPWPSRCPLCPGLAGLLTHLTAPPLPGCVQGGASAAVWRAIRLHLPALQSHVPGVSQWDRRTGKPGCRTHHAGSKGARAGCWPHSWQVCSADRRLTYARRHPLQLWSLQGERLASLAGTRLPRAAAVNSVYVSNSQDLLFAYCAPSGGQLGAAAATEVDEQEEAAAQQHGLLQWRGPAAEEGEEEEEEALAALQRLQQQTVRAPGGRAAEQTAGQGSQQSAEESGCVLVFDLLTGRQVAELRPPRTPSSAGKAAAAAAAAARAALRQCSTLFYCEASRRLYTGSADGKVHAWAL